MCIRDRYQDHWPFLDDFVVNIRMKRLPIRSSHPTVAIDKLPKPFVPPEKFLHDSCKILNRNFISAFLNWTGIDAGKLLEYRNAAWPVRLATGRYKEPFAVVRLGFGPVPSTMAGYANLLESFTESAFSLQAFNASTCPQTWLEFIVLPYNYEELFKIIEEAKRSKENLVERVYTYLKSVPAYYHNYIEVLSEKIYAWNINFSDFVLSLNTS
eukprot:TRINITY_DN6148_c0_g1_i2.p1 TRINITY_DN6148_c0_g1~~TRINITY_DN6148_c0_g1_i2.p1  ORF type:complete len:212 (+),score=56.22 TRINITY_DN6148_c0_g1_i2:79-714(+)